MSNKSTELDLDINNYDLQDILHLFKLPVNFDEQDLKRAKQIVLKTHPDKSNLPSDYFIFYSIFIFCYCFAILKNYFIFKIH